MNNIYFTQFTQKNTILKDKPNEDYILIDEIKKIYIILDGVTRDMIKGRYPNPSPSEKVTHLISNSIYEYIKNNMRYSQSHEDIENLLMKSIEFGNNNIREFTTDKQFDFMPGAVGIASMIVDETFYYAYIGDCIGLKISENNSIIFTEKQTDLIQKFKPYFTQRAIREEICNNPNHPYAYGVINGDEKAIAFVKTGYFKLDKNVQIILATDGMESYLMHNIKPPYKIYNAKELVIESNKFSNTEHEDDKSIIVINFQ